MFIVKTSNETYRYVLKLADLEKETSLMKIKDLLEEEKPNIKLLINAAGFGKFEKSTNISLEDSVGMIKVNDMALTSFV